ncbi:helix-turn-helix transcriptional regulator [Haladaptatus sp. NG-SE-30]
MSTPDPLDDVAFLARSPHRVGVLEILAEGRMTRRDLHDETGISQPTLGRILEPFRDRNWVERRGQEYALTAWGNLLADDFGDLLETVESIQRLSDVVQQLPIDEMDFDVREFRDATLTKPTAGDAFRHVRRLEELFFGADHARLLSPTVATGAPEDYEEMSQEFLDGDQYAESVVPGEVLAQVQADETYVEMFRPAFESGRMRMVVYDGPIPYLLAITDGITLLAPTDNHGIPIALVETETEVVRAWAESTYEEYREEGTELTLDDIPG